MYFVLMTFNEIQVTFPYDPQLTLVRLWNQARIRSCDQPVPSN